jgi:hypothetical protein
MREDEKMEERRNGKEKRKSRRDLKSEIMEEE